MARRPRPNALPDHTEYRDTGCEVAPACLACPLPRCRFDGPGGRMWMLDVRQIRNQSRDADIIASHAAGERPHDIADRLGVSRRTVFRVLSERVATLSE